MSERMEELYRSLFLNHVPATWAKLAFPSTKALAAWVDNLTLRAAQLQNWVDSPSKGAPLVTRIDYLFKPVSFLTAILQRTAQKQKYELDKLVIYTELTRKSTEQVEARPPRDDCSAYISGLFLEGARWNWVTGQMEECLPGFREMVCALPVINCKAMLADKVEKGGIYRCPVYTTQQRGKDYVFTAQLRSKLPAAKWALAGAAITMEVDE